MNFFKSVFSDDPETSGDLQSVSQIESNQSESEDDDRDGDQFKAGSAWSFGGLIKTIASKSESVIQTYRKDLEDFGSGLRMETEVIRNVASRAVEDLPATIEVGAIVAQESLESFGQAIDDFGSTVWKGTAEIIAQGKESILVADDQDSSSEHSSTSTTSRGLNFSKYSRFEALVRAMQCDESTYYDEPEDKGDYDDWKLGFEVGDKGSEIMDLIAGNEAIEGLYKKLVPEKFDHGTFWCRYYYKLHKLKQVEEARERIVKRALAGVDDEDLSWDIDDDDDGTGEFDALKSKDLAAKDDSKRNDGGLADGEGIPAEKSTLSAARNENVCNEVDDKKADRCDSGKDSDLSVVLSQPSFPDEGDLEWDKIEDIVNHFDGRAIRSGSPGKIDLYKHTDAAEEDEDLSWDIEDDDKPSKP